MGKSMATYPAVADLKSSVLDVHRWPHKQVMNKAVLSTEFVVPIELESPSHSCHDCIEETQVDRGARGSWHDLSVTSLLHSKTFWS